MALPMNIGSIYTFDTLAPSILGVMIKNAKLISIMDYDSAIKEDEIGIKYRNILPLLPTGTPISPETSLYYKFKSEIGEHIILSERWIDPTSIIEVTAIRLKVTVENAKPDDIDRIRRILSSAGYTAFNIEQIS